MRRKKERGRRGKVERPDEGKRDGEVELETEEQNGRKPRAREKVDKVKRK